MERYYISCFQHNIRNGMKKRRSTIFNQFFAFLLSDFVSDINIEIGTNYPDTDETSGSNPKNNDKNKNST